MFRYSGKEALINRLGFTTMARTWWQSTAAVAREWSLAGDSDCINIGKSKITPLVRLRPIIAFV